MKCRELRTRYVVFTGLGGLDPRTIPGALAKYLPPESRITVVDSDKQNAILRLDQRALASIRSHLGREIAIQIGEMRITSVVATGSVKKAKEKIKAIQTIRDWG
ncbi:MAG: hypothetical protein QFX35_03245 [Candidatus Verstraetearchaeota archaeon]|nr:hypothetical protein [Candidatus Verstraetearchaeota archaeon]